MSPNPFHLAIFFPRCITKPLTQLALCSIHLSTPGAAEFSLVLVGCLSCVAAAVGLFNRDYVVLSVMVTTVTFWVLSLAVIKRLRAQMIDSIFALPAILFLTTGLTIALRSDFVMLLLLLTVIPFFFFFVLVSKHIPRLS